MLKSVFFSLFLLLTFVVAAQWKTLDTNGSCTARHEAGFVAHSGNLYLMGGRGIKPVEKYSPDDNTWTTLKPTPIEMHHFTPVSLNGKIYVMGGMTGNYPKELPLSHIYTYDPEADIWEKVFEIPENRRRGGGGVVVHKKKIYFVNGITYGHTSGTCAMFDVYDPSKNTWTVLLDAPTSRDHNGAVVIGNQLIAIGGRNTSYHEPDNFASFFATPKSSIDYFDFKTKKWATYTASLPVPGAGAGVVQLDGKVYFIGGETGEDLANNDVYAFDPSTQQWIEKPSLVRGRHGTNATVHNGRIYIAAGCANRGGNPELNSIEVYIE